jgi:colanic acid/amylovoran biosynthesis glycosyltransferase
VKVLYLLRYYPALTETFVAAEMAGVHEAGVTVAVAALGTRRDGALVGEVPDIVLHRVPRRPLAGRLSRASRGERWLRTVQRDKDAARLPWLRQLATGFDRIHVHFAGEAAEFAHALHLDLGMPYTVTVHAADLFKPRPALRTVLVAAERVLTISKHNQATLDGLGVLSSVVRCGPDLDRFKPVEPRAGPLRALFVGRDVPKKGLDTLLEAWDGLDRPDAKLTLITDKPRGAPRGGVEVVGLLPPAKVQQWMARSQVLVLPARRADDGDMDGVPLVLMEALAMGRPVIASTVSGIPELVDTAVGWLVPSNDPSALRRAIQAAADDPLSRERRGGRGPQRLRERGYHLRSQVEGVMDAWMDDGAGTSSMAEDGIAVE